jgi:hypothetical protein
MNKQVTTEINQIDNHSAEISANAKGQVTFSVKAYGSTPKSAKDRALKMFRELKQDLAESTPEREQGSSLLP